MPRSYANLVARELSASLASDSWLNTRLGLNGTDVAAQAALPRRALLWHDERVDGHLSFLLFPATATLVAGFRLASGWSVRVGVGRTLRFVNELAALRRGDIFCWVNPLTLTADHRPALPFRELRARGVHLVLYSTESSKWCPDRAKMVDEVWEFGWAGLQACTTGSCKQSFPAPSFNGTRAATVDCAALKGDVPQLTLRLVPPGYLPSAPAALEHAVHDDAPHACERLQFLGSSVQGLQPKDWRVGCFDVLKRALGSRLVETYSAWDDRSLSRILASGGFYLNLHKGCEAGGRSPVTFRTSRILSMPLGGVILSERCHPLDEAEFRGLMHFMPAADIPAAFERLCRDSSAWSRQAAHAHRRFRARFEPQRLFERARVYELLASLNRKARQAEGTRTAAPAEPSAPAPRVTTNLAPCTVDTTKPTP